MHRKQHGEKKNALNVTPKLYGVSLFILREDKDIILRKQYNWKKIFLALIVIKIAFLIAHWLGKAILARGY